MFVMRSLTSLSIKSKLIMMLLAVSSGSILVTTYIGYRSGQANLTDRVFSQLTSVRASKAYQIESYFKNVRSHTQTLSESPGIIAAMQDFTSAYRQLETVSVPKAFDQKLNEYYRDEFLTRLAKAEGGSPVLQSYIPKTPAERYLQYQYIAGNANPVGKKLLLNDPKDGSEYSKLHARYHPIFRNIVQKFGYYDMFLIDTQGIVVYTVFKETDFTTNYGSGPYKESNLAKLNVAVQAAKQRDYAKIIDFAAYGPSYGAPAAFIAAPIFNESELVGVLAFQLPADEINNVMTGTGNWESDGLGKTGETYLVGRDALMRSISRFLVQDPEGYAEALRATGVKDADINRISQYGTSILQQSVRSNAVASALIGKQGTQIINDYRGVPVLSSYAPLQIEGLDWVILSEMNLSEAYAPIDSFGRQILVSATLLMLLITLLAMALAYLFVKPINQLIQSSRRVAAGDLDAIAIPSIATLDTEDEFGELAKSFNSMVYSLRTQTQLVEQKNQENEKFLLNVFPAAIAKRLKKGEKNIAEGVSNVAVLYADITGFSKLSASLTAYESVAVLNDLVTAFDDAADRYGMEKIKTDGDNYLALCGLSTPYLDHDKRAVDFAIELLAIVRRFNHERDFQLNVQTGIHAGDVVAGIVGKIRSTYDVWGRTINMTYALKEACPPGVILVSSTVYNRLKDIYQFEPREVVSNGSNGGSSEAVKAWRLKNTQMPVESEKLGV
jgi:class 3 adenylate cyclase